MTPALEYDDAAARRLEAMYTTHDVVAQRREVLRSLALWLAIHRFCSSQIHIQGARYSEVQEQLTGR